MTPVEEIIEIVNKTICLQNDNRLVYNLTSFNGLSVSKMPNCYSVRIKSDLSDDEKIQERYELLRDKFLSVKLEFRNLILQRDKSIILSGKGRIIINEPYYYDCVFTDETKKLSRYCFNCEAKLIE